MKARWDRETLGELCDEGGGGVQTGPFGSQLHQSDYVEHGTPVVMPRDILDRQIDESQVARVSQRNVDRLSRHELIPGDIVYGRRGDIGRQALVHEDQSGWLCGTGCLRIRLGNSKVLPGYLSLYLNRPEIIGWIQNQAIGATLPNLNTGILRRVPVSYPSTSSQRKIIAAVSAYDDLIENNNRRIVMLEKMAEEVYREWFVRVRFPDHGSTPVHKGVPEGWTVETIEEAFDFTGGGTPSKKQVRYWADGSVNWYTPSDITSASGIFHKLSATQCTEEGVRNSSARMFPAYSIMLTSRATIGAIGINTTPACTNQGFITCIPNERYPLVFLFHWLKLAKPYFETLSSGATFAELTKGTFKRIRILRPSGKLLYQYESQARPMFSLVENLLSENELLAQTRDLLLGRLMSGRLSLENLDIQFPPSMR